MTRPLRIEYPGAFYHVMNRGQRQDAIVDDDYDRELRQVVKANNGYLRRNPLLCSPFSL